MFRRRSRDLIKGVEAALEAATTVDVLTIILLEPQDASYTKPRGLKGILTRGMAPTPASEYHKMPVTAVHLMNSVVLPTFESHGARITTVLSDNVLCWEGIRLVGVQVSVRQFALAR